MFVSADTSIQMALMDVGFGSDIWMHTDMVGFRLIVFLKRLTESVGCYTRVKSPTDYSFAIIAITAPVSIQIICFSARRLIT